MSRIDKISQILISFALILLSLWLVLPAIGDNFESEAHISTTSYIIEASEYHESATDEKVSDYYMKYLTISPDNATYWNNKGIALATIGWYQEAANAYDNALKVNSSDNSSNAIFLLNKGVALARANKHLEAIKLYDKSIELDPNVTATIAWTNKGISLSKLGKYKEAIEAYDIAINLSPNSAEIPLYRKAQALKSLNQVNEAKIVLDEAKKIDINIVNNKFYFIPIHAQLRELYIDPYAVNIHI